MNQYLSEVLNRLDSPASLFIGAIMLVCLLAGLFGGDNKDGES